MRSDLCKKHYNIILETFALVVGLSMFVDDPSNGSVDINKFLGIHVYPMLNCHGFSWHPCGIDPITPVCQLSRGLLQANSVAIFGSLKLPHLQDKPKIEHNQSNICLYGFSDRCILSTYNIDTTASIFCRDDKPLLIVPIIHPLIVITCQFGPTIKHLFVIWDALGSCY